MIIFLPHFGQLWSTAMPNYLYIQAYGQAGRLDAESRLAETTKPKPRSFA